MRQRKTKDCQYHIVTCLGEHIKTVRLRIPVDADPNDYQGGALTKAGIKNHICGGCDDHAYHISQIIEV